MLCLIGDASAESCVGRAGTMLVKILRMHSLDDAPWTWQSSWNSDMPDFFQGMPNGVYDNIYEDLDDSPVSWHITEVRASQTCPPSPARAVFLMCPGPSAHPNSTA